MAQFETIHDIANSKIGFLPTACVACQTTLDNSGTGYSPTTSSSSSSSTIGGISTNTVIIAAVVGVIGLIAVMYVLVRCCRKSKVKIPEHRTNQGAARSTNHHQQQRRQQHLPGIGHKLGSPSSISNIALPVASAVNSMRPSRNGNSSNNYANNNNSNRNAHAPTASAPNSTAAAAPVFQTYYTPQGQPYYYNVQTQQSVWERPPASALISSAQR